MKSITLEKFKQMTNSKTFFYLCFPVTHNLSFHRDAIHLGCKQNEAESFSPIYP